MSDGAIRGVRQEVWDFSVTGWLVVPRVHRTARGRGERTSELDAIRPEVWSPDWNDELLDLLRALTAALDLRPEQDDLLEPVLAGPLIASHALPSPTQAERTVPATEAVSAEQLPLG